MKQILAALLALVVLTSAASAQSRVQVGRLSCDVHAGIGLLIGSQKDMDCVFYRDGRRPEVYGGTITKLGLDIGVTGRTKIEWLVFSASNVSVDRRSLAGTYVGGSGEATFGVGLGANWLIGGSRRGFALQPISVQAQTGVNLSLAFAGLELY